jgi:hypothetical protein
VNPRQHFIHRHFLTAMKRVSRIAPMASQVAASQADKNARQSREVRLSLNRLEDFRYDHSIVAPCRRPKTPPAFYPIFFLAYRQPTARNPVAKWQFVSRIGSNHVQKVLVARLDFDVYQFYIPF